MLRKRIAWERTFHVLTVCPTGVKLANSDCGSYTNNMTSSKKTESTGYVPGVCNINHKEIALRRKVGMVALVVFALVLALLLTTAASKWWRLFLITPAFISALGFLQAKNKFCVMYASEYKQNASEGSKSARTVTDKLSREADTRRARQINLQSFAVTGVVMVVVFLLPR